LTLPGLSPSAILARQLFLKSIAQYSPAVVVALTDAPVEIHEQVSELVLESGGRKSPYVPKAWYQALSDWRYLRDVVRYGKDYINLHIDNGRVARWKIDYLETVFQYFCSLYREINTWAEYWYLQEVDKSGLDDYFGMSHFKSPALFAVFSQSVLGKDIATGWLEAATILDGLPNEFPHVSPKPFVFRYSPGWSPTAQKRSEVVRELKSAFEKQLAGYLDSQEELARSQPFLEQAPRVINEDHIKWLVYYQVLSWSYQRIANDLAFRDRKSVEQAVKSTAERVGLRLRPPGRSGRPKSSPLPSS
jgi:hypothetical protein